jgi:subtilase family serine protease
VNARTHLVPLAAAILAASLGSPAYAAASAPLRDLGRADASTRVDVALVLNYRNEAQLDQLIEAQADETSPLYHHFIDQAQFADYFAPSAADYARVIASLGRAGFTVTQTFANRTVVDASAPAPVAERYFNTEIHRVQQPGVGTQYVNVRPASTPAEIAGLVTGFVGLSTIRTMHPDYAFLPAAAGHAGGQVVKNGNPLFGPDGGYGPQIFINSYDLPAGSGTTGSGRASGVAGDADFLDSDLAGYLSYFGVTRTGPTTVRVKVDGGPPAGNGGADSVETALDVETIVSLAPGTALYVNETKPFYNLMYFIDMYNRVVSDNFVDTLNTSYSQCETAFEPKFPKMADKIEKQGSVLGITFHASAGDGGVDTYGCGEKVSVGTPTDTPHNISVGGTILDVNSSTGQETSETGWNDSSGATGGGVSIVFKLPSWQKKVPNIITSGRNLPDVAFDASPYTGESYYYNGQWQGPIGGTSLSSPIFGAALTEIDQLHGSRAGYLNTSLYKTWLKDGYGSGSTAYFRDITSGSIPPYSAKAGYDQMSGIGAALATNLSGILPY